MPSKTEGNSYVTDITSLSDFQRSQLSDLNVALQKHPKVTTDDTSVRGQVDVQRREISQAQQLMPVILVLGIKGTRQHCPAGLANSTPIGATLLSFKTAWATQ